MKSQKQILLLTLLLPLLWACSATPQTDSAENAESTAPPERTAQTLPIPGSGGPASSNTDTHGPLTWDVPDSWVVEQPSQFDALCTVPSRWKRWRCRMCSLLFRYGSGWRVDGQRTTLGRTILPTRRPQLPRADAAPDPSRNGHRPPHMVSLTGTYMGGMSTGIEPAPPLDNAMLLGGIIEGPDAPWFFKFTGPASTVSSQRTPSSACCRVRTLATEDKAPRQISIVRILLTTSVFLIFVISLAGIWISGPVVVRVPSVEITATPSVERMRADVAQLCNSFSPRDYEHPENLSQAASWIFSQFHEAGLHVEMQRYVIAGKAYINVIGQVPGTDPERGALVIGAHYDAFMEHPAADDNASGVAVLLELVRTLPQQAPRRSWYFVAFSTEEPPFFGTEHMGSAHFARRLRDRNIDVNLMIALDGVGRYSDEPGSQSFPMPAVGFLYPSAGNFIAVVGNMNSGRSLRRVKSAILSTRSIAVATFRAPAVVQGVDWSDHASFWRYDMPAVLLTDTLYARHGDYHSATDTPDKLDYEKMTQLVIGLHGVLHPDIRVRAH